LEVERNIESHRVQDDRSKEVGYDETCSGVVSYYFEGHDWECYARLDKYEERKANTEYHQRRYDNGVRPGENVAS
jgi:hypothetical protein